MYNGEFNERRYLLPHRPAPAERCAILWSAATPRPVPVVFGFWEQVAPGVMLAVVNGPSVSSAPLVRFAPVIGSANGRKRAPVTRSRWNGVPASPVGL